MDDMKIQELINKAIEELKSSSPPPLMSRTIFIRGTEENIKVASQYAKKYIVSNGIVFYKNGRKLPVKETSDVKE